MTELRGRRPVAVAILLVGLLVAALAATPKAEAVINPGSMAGIVTNLDGDPLPGITVSVFHYGQVVHVETDATGAFQVDNLAADPYYKVRFTDPGADYATEWYDDGVVEFPDSTFVPITAYTTTFGVDATLEPAASISGRLTSSTGAPVTGGKVALWLGSAGYWSTDIRSETDETGQFTISRLKAATYVVEFYDPATGIQEFWNDSPSLHGASPLVVTQGDSLTADAVLGGRAQNLTAPSISGTAQVGQTLTASAGTWKPAGTAVTYQWVVGAGTMSGDAPTGPTYTPTAADVGQTIRVHATGTYPGWLDGSAWSGPTTAVVPALAPPPLPAVTNVVRPRVKGTIELGEVVRVSKGVWKPSAVVFKYQWYAGGKAITDATHRRLTVSAKFVGKRLSVRVKAKAAGYARAIVWTQPTVRIKSGHERVDLASSYLRAD